jgi:hypothetical protein
MCLLCIYDYSSFWGPFANFFFFFIKMNFQMKYFESSYLLYLYFPQYVIWFFKVNFELKWILKCINFARFCVLSWKLSQFQIILKHINIFKFSFLYYKLQLFFEQHIHCITFTCHKGFMNFKQTLNFDKHKIEHYENLSAF